MLGGGVSEDMELSGIPQSPSSHTRASSHCPHPGTHPVPAASLLAPLTTSHEGCGRNPRHFQVPTCCPPGAPRLLSHGGGGTSPETLWRHVPRLQVPESSGGHCVSHLPGRKCSMPRPQTIRALTIPTGSWYLGFPKVFCPKPPSDVWGWHISALPTSGKCV